MLRDEELDKLGFDLGWDFAVYGIKPLETSLPSILEGYEYGIQTKSKRFADIFERKYLYLRYSALNRGRAVSEYVTPQLISYLCTRRCPITRQKLTVRTQMETDWSIDRVNNNGAYAPGNMVVMSVKANKAKGCKSADDIRQIVEDLSANAEFEGLSVMEWRRLSWLAEKCESERPVPLVIRPPPLIMMNTFDALQLLAALAANQNSASRIKKMCNAKQAKLYTKFVKAFSRYCPQELPTRMVLDTYQVPSVFAKFCDFYDSLGEGEMFRYRPLIAGFAKEPVFDDQSFLRRTFRKLWMLESNGYVSDTQNPLSQSEASALEQFLKQEIGERVTGDPFDPFLLIA